MKIFIVDDKNKGQRLNKFCGRILKEAPDSFVYKMLRKKNITLNKKKAGGAEILNEGDEVCFFLADETFEKFSGKTDENKVNPGVSPVESKRIVYEDDDVLVCYKKAGELSQKAEKNDISVNERMLAYLEKKDKDTGFTPGVINRLDRNTDGLIVMGKNVHAASVLSKAFAGHELEKNYIAAVKGQKDRLKEGRLSLYLKKDNDENISEVFENEVPGSVRIESEIFCIAESGKYSLLKIRLLTGKSHQIRASLKFLGLSVVGDPKYGDREDNRINREKYGIYAQLLTAYELKFPESFPELPALAGRSIKTELSESFRRFIDGNGLKEG